MSGIYIRGIEMPKGCSGCPIDSDSCTLWQKLPPERLRDTRPEECPLVPVPEHDGPLVDALDIINAFPDEFIFTNEQARALTNYIIPADPIKEATE